MDLAIVTIPPLTDHTHTVVFLHGRGDNAKDFASSIHYSTTSRGLTLPEAFPSFRWVFPSAGILDVACMPGDRRSQWFDIWDVSNFKDHEEVQQPGLRESVAALRKILRSEAETLGGQWGKVVLAGISQGGAVGAHTLLNLATDGETRLGAFLGFSSRLPFPGRSLPETRKVLALEGVPAGNGVLRKTPVLLEHCVDDPLVLVDWGRQLRDQLVEFGAQVTWKEYPDGGHWFNSPKGIDDAVAFISQSLDVRREGRGVDNDKRSTATKTETARTEACHVTNSEFRSLRVDPPAVEVLFHAHLAMARLGCPSATLRSSFGSGNSTRKLPKIDRHDDTQAATSAASDELTSYQQYDNLDPGNASQARRPTAARPRAVAPTQEIDTRIRMPNASMDCKTTALESRGTALPTHAGKNGNESLKTLALRGVLSGDAGLVSSNYLKSDPYLEQRVPHASTNDRLAPDRLHLFTSGGFANIQTKAGMEGIFHSLRFPLRTIFGA